MSPLASSTFDIDTWDEEAYDEREGAKLSRAHLTKTFHGDIEGRSTTDLLLAIAQEEGSAAYVGFERILAAVHGRSGSFVLHHNASSARGVQSATWAVVPDSGTDGLRGLHGEGDITVEPDGGHIFTFDYSLD